MTPGKGRSTVRLLWDEDLSSRVGEALRVLGFNVTWPGSQRDEGVPAKGASDAELVAFAQRTRQVIVTSNHDMMALCEESGQRFVWVDPRGRQLKLEALVVLAFQQIARWDEILDSDPDACVHAMRTRCDAIDAATAAALARNRMRALERRRRNRTRSTPPPTPGPELAP